MVHHHPDVRVVAHRLHALFGDVELAFALVAFDELCDHYHAAHPLGPYHAPKVADCVRHGALGGDVGTRFSFVAVYVVRVYIGC